MNTLISKDTMMNEEAKGTFSFSKEVDGVSKSVRGEQVENGWLITIESSWDEADSIAGSRERKYDCKKYITKANPLDKFRKKKPEGEELEDAGDMWKEITEAQGMLLVD